MRLESRVERLRLRAALRLLNLLSPVIVKLGSPAQQKEFAAEWEAHDEEASEKWRSLHTQALFMSVGQALSQWAGMEELLIAIASLLLRTYEVNKVGTIMYSIISFPVWLAIIGELFSQEPLYSTLKPKWNKINDRLKGLKDIRDQLAHHTIYYGERVSTITSDTGLRPGRFDTRQKSQKYQPLDYDQISKFMDSMGKITNDLRGLLTDMTELLQSDTSQRKSSEPTPDHSP